MGVFDKFLDIMKLNEDDYDDQYDEYDEGGFYDDDEYEEKPRHSFFGKKNNSSKEDSYKDFDVEEEKEFQPAKSKVTQMRTPARHSSSGNMEVCVVKPGSVDDSREITETLLRGRTVILNLEGMDLQLMEIFRKFLTIFSLLHRRTLIFPVIFRIFLEDLWRQQVSVEDTRIRYGEEL